MSGSRRSVIVSRAVSGVDVTVLDYNRDIFTLHVKKDDYGWTIKKHRSEIIFFRNTVLETAQTLKNPFPIISKDNKDLIAEMSIWLKECGDALLYSSSQTSLFYSFLKANEYSVK